MCVIYSEIYLFILFRKGFKILGVQDPKCMPHFSVTEIRISLLFEENTIIILSRNNYSNCWFSGDFIKFYNHKSRGLLILYLHQDEDT